MEKVKKTVIKFSVGRLILMIIEIAIVLSLGVSGVTYSRYVLNKGFSAKGTSAAFYFEAEVTPSSAEYIKGKDSSIPIEILIKNYEGTNFNKYETKYEITYESSKFTLEGETTGSIESAKTDKNIELQLKPTDEDQLIIGTTETIELKINSTEPYAKEITKQIEITIQDEFKDLKIGEAINADKYGDEVIGYECSDPEAQEEAGCWRLFYQNDEYTYLISDNSIALNDTIENLYTSAGWGDKTGANVNGIGQNLNPMLKDAGGFTSDNTNYNIKATGYLTDPTQWSKYKGPDAIFAIGGPSIELFVNSFNLMASKENLGITITVSATPKGYLADKYEWESRIFDPKYSHGIYGKYTVLTSPPENCATNIYNIFPPRYLYRNNLTNDTANKGFCIRPIVCIKTPVFKEKYEETLESNYIGLTSGQNS